MNTCSVCGKKKFEERDGRTLILRCDCDWRAAYLRRVHATVHSDYYQKWAKDWDPEIFKVKSSKFVENFIRLQKAAAMIRLWQFGFKKVTLPNGTINNAIFLSTQANRNLFIRGHNGSGRGLLSAVFKKLAAGKEISVSPYPSEFDVFKTECIEAAQYGKAAEDMRLKLEAKYVDPTVMLLETMKAEVQVKTESKFFERRKFKASDFIDSLLIKRMSKNGSIFITSTSFMGEVMDDYGERLMEVLSDPSRTSIILLFSIPEAEEIKMAITERFANAGKIASGFAIKEKAGSPTRLDKQVKAEHLKLMEEILYLYAGLEKTISKLTLNTDVDIIKAIWHDDGRAYDPDLLRVRNSVEAEREQGSETYNKSVREAISNAIKSRKAIGSRLTDYECMETAKMLAKSESDSETERFELSAKKAVAEMSGGK